MSLNVPVSAFLAILFYFIYFFTWIYNMPFINCTDLARPVSQRQGTDPQFPRSCHQSVPYLHPHVKPNATLSLFLKYFSITVDI